MVGHEHADDAGVYRLTDELALIQTLDFFTPIVDDPYLFGQIAAANALSDVYAMGGRPICAMNIVCFPAKQMAMEVLREILRGGLNKVQEAGAALAGGHSIDDPEIKFGLSVSGVVHPRQIWTNCGARAGDRLVLTKPLGTGVISTALKRGKASSEALERSVLAMSTLNRDAADVLRQHEVHACTDVTGFGLLGHACEMIDGAEVGLALHARRAPLLDGALDYATAGLTPGGLARNRAHRESQVEADGVDPALLALLYDPQTSGGLLAAVPEAEADAVAQALEAAGVLAAAVIGEVNTDDPGRVRVVA